MSDFTVRAMETRDLAMVGQLAGRLVNLHHAYDAQRFMHLPNAAQGYARYLGTVLDDASTIVIVAERAGAVVGYVYARLEPRSYNDLIDAHGKLHDVYVDESARAMGIGEALVRETMRRMKERGAPRMILATAAQNEAAQRLFKRCGLRVTMLEMTVEL